jgi:hypothetical protein
VWRLATKMRTHVWLYKKNPTPQTKRLQVRAVSKTSLLKSVSDIGMSFMQAASEAHVQQRGNQQRTWLNPSIKEAASFVVFIDG